MKIYKYASIDKGELMLDKSRVLLRNPEKYNDPFDCLFKPTQEEKDACREMILYYYFFKFFAGIIENKEIKGVSPFLRFELKFYKMMMKKNPYYDKMPVFDGVMKIVLDKYTQKNSKVKRELENDKLKFSKDIEMKIEEVRKALLVTCFSLTNKSILLWSHYGDGHTGVCIEFDVDPKEYEKVKYSKNRQRLDLKFITAVVLGHDFIGEEVDTSNQRIMKSISKVLLTKALDWQYEDEVRIIRSANKKYSDVKHEQGDDDYYLTMDNITRVYVGCRAQKEKVDELRRKFPNLEIVQMKDSAYKYELEEQD